MPSTASDFNRKQRANSGLRKLRYSTNMNLMFSSCFVKPNFVEVGMETHIAFLGGKNGLSPYSLNLNRRM